MWTEENGKGHRAVWNVHGKPKKGLTFATEVEAIAWYNEHGPKVGVKGFSELLELWRTDEPSDYREEASALLGKLAVTRSWIKVADITPAAIAEWKVAAKGVGVSRTMAYLLRVLRWGKLTYEAPANEKTIGLRPPKTARKAKPPLLTDEQAEAIRACSFSYGVRAQAIVDYLLTYGARPITACRLTEDALDLGRSELAIEHAKHSGGWRHPVEEEQAGAWAQVAKDTTYDKTVYNGPRPLFPHYKEDRPWRVTGGHAHELTDWYKSTIAKKLKLPANVRTIYHLKRYAITRMLRAGIDAYQVSLFTGHLDVKQVLTYNTANEESARQALEKLRVSDNHLNHLSDSHKPLSIISSVGRAADS